MTRSLRLMTVPVLLSSAIAAGTASASDYQGEAEIGWTESHQWGGAFRYYLDPVSTDRGPLAEAAFLNRARGLELGVGYNTETSADTISGAFDYYSGDLYLSGGVSRTSASDDVFDSSGESYSARAGWMVMQNTRVSAGWTHARNRATVDLPGHSLRVSDSTDLIDVSVKHLMMLDGDSAINVTGGLVFNTDTDSTAFGTGLDYYPTRNLSIGTAVSHGNSSTDLEFNTQYFFTPNVSARAAWRNPEFGDSRFSLGLMGRF